ncbi:unnamed protein product [Acanthoscelides obtectus]|uniref:acid phosphatase n=1 Tax=Acanthoscelides obtectus TaxID=200917 RepID=A0A9P0P541_ACAOB|nr:unnamed protein product [Acanthoscelides obtectus]CAK1629326.1 Prostatic acid phosphatase [Acanthoscelides obtectus]
MYFKLISLCICCYFVQIACSQQDGELISVVTVGIQEQYDLGKWVRERYHDFLPKEYSSKQVYVRSTDHERTLTSAEAHLAGLFPPQGREIWNKSLLWRPIPVHTTWKDNDDVLAMDTDCPKYDRLYKDLMNSDYFMKIDEDNKELYSKDSHIFSRRLLFN